MLAICDVYSWFSLVRVVLYTVLMDFPLPKTPVKTLSKNLNKKKTDQKSEGKSPMKPLGGLFGRFITAFKEP